jgi:hypothetical protein
MAEAKDRGPESETREIHVYEKNVSFMKKGAAKESR